MYFTIFLYVFMSDILIHTPPYFLMWSISGHSVSARLAGLSDPRIPLLPLLLSWDYKYSPQCLIFLWVLGIWTHVPIAKQTIHIPKHLSSPNGAAYYPLKIVLSLLKDDFSLLLNADSIFLFFLLFSLKKRKTIYIPFTFCFHFFLPSCPSLLSSSFCKAILLRSHWVAYTVPKLVIFLPHLPNIIIIALSYHAQEYLFLCNTTTLRWNLLQKLLILAHFITYIMQIWVYKYILYEYIVCVLQDMNMNLP